MYKVVIDTNVYISSLISPQGLPAKVMRLVESKKLIILVSYAILDEYNSVTLYPNIKKLHGFSKKEVSKKIFRLTKLGETISPKIRLEIIIDDPDDNKFLECAVEGEADFIISGDKHLKNLKSFQGIKIVYPTSFLALMK